MSPVLTGLWTGWNFMQTLGPSLIVGLCVPQEALQCVDELDLGPQLNIFVRVGVESTLERSQITRDHMGQLFFQLVQQGLLPKAQFNKGSVQRPEPDDSSDCHHGRFKMPKNVCMSLFSQVRRHAGTSGRHGHRHSAHLAVPGRAAQSCAEGRGLLYERAL